MIPLEWLNEVIQHRDGFHRLLAEEGGCLSSAAHRLAKAKCMTWERATAVPSRSEVRAAAVQIATRVGQTPPDTATLVRDCEAMGLLVI